MSKKNTYILLILLTIIIGCILSWWLCCCSYINRNINKIDSSENSKVSTVTSLKETKKNPFSISDSQTDFMVNSNTNFNFNLSNNAILLPIAVEIDSNIDKLKTYLGKYPNKTLDVVGHYKSDETNKTSFDNLGLARASSIKEYLVSKGISDSKITMKSILNDEINADENSVLFGPVTFNLLVNSKEKAKKEALKTSIISNPLVVNFDLAKSTYKVTDVESEKITNIVNYLNNNEGATLSIIGHTDSSGSSETNKKLGKARADFIKGILVKNGAPANRIKTSSRGEEVPVASNDTEEGKRKNRRIEYKIN